MESPGLRDPASWIPLAACELKQPRAHLFGHTVSVNGRYHTDYALSVPYQVFRKG